MTYAEFDVAVNRAAHALAARGLAKGDRLALLSHNCRQYAVLTFATAKLGVVLVPVNFMLTAHEIAYILDHSGATGIVAEDALVPVAAEALGSRDRRTLRISLGSGWVPSRSLEVPLVVARPASISEVLGPVHAAFGQAHADGLEVAVQERQDPQARAAREARRPVRRRRA
jgi:acyl-CoA synthetase (AMP-forming)/AMP-acid ligase II